MIEAETIEMLRADLAAAHTDIIEKNRRVALLKQQLKSVRAIHEAYIRGKSGLNGDSEWSYADYLKSEHWRATRDGALRRANWRCQLCGTVPEKRGGLHVHHNTYKNLGREQPEDIIVLCKRCHKRHHDAEKAT